jgi:16S rRNA (adenine1518-N6/adenine1519-N6)-dimethyltransferase
MGQNFLIEGWVPARTAEVSGAAPGVGVLEIGPGIGPLTVELASRAEKVISVELDRSLLPVLQETLADFHNVQVISGDILKLDIRALCESNLPGLSWIACANLPYNITTPVITALIQARCFSSITVMIQREVALRICAAPGTADYGAFSVFCQFHAECRLLYDVPPECFYPAPRVMSSVIRLDLRQSPPAEVENQELFFRVVRASFAQRRKTLLNGLCATFGATYSKEELGEILEECGLAKSIRGERLGIPEFAQLAKKLEKRR